MNNNSFSTELSEYVFSLYGFSFFSPLFPCPRFAWAFREKPATQHDSHVINFLFFTLHPTPSHREILMEDNMFLWAWMDNTARRVLQHPPAKKKNCTQFYSSGQSPGRLCSISPRQLLPQNFRPKHGSLLLSPISCDTPKLSYLLPPFLFSSLFVSVFCFSCSVLVWVRLSRFVRLSVAPNMPISLWRHIAIQAESTSYQFLPCITLFYLFTYQRSGFKPFNNFSFFPF